jgi:hypothetical protein
VNTQLTDRPAWPDPPTGGVELDPLHDQLVALFSDPRDGEWARLALLTVLDVVKKHEHAALRGREQLPVPGWVSEMRQAIAATLGLRLPASQAEGVQVRRWGGGRR